MQDAKGTKCAKGVITIEDDETVKMMNKICDEGSAIENVLGDDEPEKREVSLTLRIRSLSLSLTSAAEKVSKVEMVEKVEKCKR